MTLLLIGRLLMMGLLVWTMPLTAYMGLFDKSGRLTVTYDVVKMMVIMMISTNITLLVIHLLRYIRFEIDKEYRLIVTRVHGSCVVKRDMTFSR